MAHPAERLPADEMVPRLARVTHSQSDGHDMHTLELVLEEGSWQGFIPGQINMLSVFGVGEIPVSFSGDPHDASKIVHTVRAVGPVSAALVAMKKGQHIGIRGPYGVGWDAKAAEGRDAVIVAGGLGLAPVRPLLYDIMARRQAFKRVMLFYGARHPSEMLYRREIERWRARGDLEIGVTVDHADAQWQGDVGVVTTLIDRAEVDPDVTTAYVCGPEVMMRFAARSLIGKGVPERAIYLSMERNMKCSIGQCGHCQLGPYFVCKDGPVFSYDRIGPLMVIKEL